MTNEAVSGKLELGVIGVVIALIPNSFSQLFHVDVEYLVE